MMATTEATQREIRIAILVIILAVVVAYSNSFRVPFLLDDSWRIVENQAIHQWQAWPVAFYQSNRSLVNVTFSFNYAIHGLELWGYHLTNLAIHLTAGCLLFGVARQALQRCGEHYGRLSAYLGMMIALLWVLHPLQTSAVTYINQRFESLMGMLYFASLYCFARGINSSVSWRWLITSVVACGLGMMCKESMIAAPMMILWFDRAFVAASWGQLLAARWKFYVVLSSTWGILAWEMLHYVDEYVNGGMVWVQGLNSWTYLLTQSEVIVHYLQLTFFPWGQSFVYDWPVASSFQHVWPQFTTLSLLAAITIVATYRWPKFGFLGGWFFLNLAPTSSFIAINDLAFEHRMYLAVAAPLILAVFAVEKLSRWLAWKSTVPLKVTGCIGWLTVAIFVALTVRRNHDFRSEFAIYQATLEQGLKNSKAWQGLGGAHLKAKDLTGARLCFEKAVQLAPHLSCHLINYGALLYELGELQEAKRWLQKAVSVRADDPLALRALGNIAIDQEQLVLGLQYLDQAIQLEPRDIESRTSRVAALILAKRFNEAIIEGQAILELKPTDAIARLNMAMALVSLGRNAEAIQQCKQAVEIAPELPQAHSMLGQLLETVDLEQALKHARKAYDLEPNSTDTAQLFDQLVATVNPSEAIEHFRAKLRSHSEDIETRYKLVSALLTVGNLQEAIVEMEKVVAIRPESTSAVDYLERLKQAAKR
jgi:protein O-mannosyl-transferase